MYRYECPVCHQHAETCGPATITCPHSGTIHDAKRVAVMKPVRLTEDAGVRT